MATAKDRIRAALREVGDPRADWALVYAWRISGPGPAELGWHAESPAGRCDFLGSREASAVYAIRAMGEVRKRRAQREGEG